MRLSLETLRDGQFDLLTDEQFDWLADEKSISFDLLTDEQFDALTDDDLDSMIAYTVHDPWFVRNAEEYNSLYFIENAEDFAT